MMLGVEWSTLENCLPPVEHAVELAALVLKCAGRLVAPAEDAVVSSQISPWDHYASPHTELGLFVPCHSAFLS